jgi:chloramphenicol-sensitive protein RarD
MLQAILLFGEHLSPTRLVAFGCIWLALLVYSVDIWYRLRQN